jgi:tetratricopeptide (TPR) repeat protein
VEETPPARHLTFSLVLVILVLLPFVLILGPQYVSARAQGQGRAAAEAGDYARAARSLATAAAFSPQAAGLWELAGLYAWKGGDAHSAIHYLEQASERSPLVGESLITLGDAYNAVDDPINAIVTWQAAVDEAGPTIPLMERLVVSHRLIGDARALEQDLQALARLQPDGAIFLELGLLTAVYEPDKALSYLAQATSADPALREVTDELDRTIRRARLIDDDPAYILTAVGRALASLGEWELARESFQNAVTLNPGYVDAWAFLAEARQQSGEDGGPDLDTAYSLDPDSLTVNIFYALYSQRQGQFDQALVYLETALSADPNNPIVLAEMAGTTSALGDIQTAVDLFLQAIAVDPANPTYWRLLAVYSIQNSIQIAEVGLPAARQSLLLDPVNPAALDLVGQAYLGLENPLLAERFLLEALAADPEYAPAFLHLGLLYLSTGDTVEARRNLEQVLVLEPEPQLQDQAQFILDTYLP